MTEKPSAVDALTDLVARLATEGETREEYLVRVDFPPGADTDRPWLTVGAVQLAEEDHLSTVYPVESPGTAAVLAVGLVRDWAAIGVAVTATPIRATWVLAAEEEIPLGEAPS